MVRVVVFVDSVVVVVVVVRIAVVTVRVVVFVVWGRGSISSSFPRDNAVQANSAM